MLQWSLNWLTCVQKKIYTSPSFLPILCLMGSKLPLIKRAILFRLAIYTDRAKLKRKKRSKQSGCRAAILRTILVYGVLADRSRSNLVLWAKSKLEAGETIRVVSDQWRMPTWVDDLAKVTIKAMTQHANGLFHISGSESCSILEAVHTVADYWGFDKNLITPIAAEQIGVTEQATPAKSVSQSLYSVPNLRNENQSAALFFRTR